MWQRRLFSACVPYQPYLSTQVARVEGVSPIAKEVVCQDRSEYEHTRIHRDHGCVENVPLRVLKHVPPGSSGRLDAQMVVVDPPKKLEPAHQREATMPGASNVVR
jgi:hypothetical protein